MAPILTERKLDKQQRLCEPTKEQRSKNNQLSPNLERDRGLREMEESICLSEAETSRLEREN